MNPRRVIPTARAPDAASGETERNQGGFSGACAAPGTGAAAGHGALPAGESGEWLTIEQLATGSEQIGGMLVASGPMRRVMYTIALLAACNSPVLIEGESGTGKELVAHMLHTMSPEPRAPFVTFNCFNLVDSLAAARLFGHAKEALPGATEDAPGCLRAAHGGVLFLDEIGELPLSLQARLLRVVETHEVWPVGALRAEHVEARLIAATSRDLRAMARAGQFRDDLYYRLNAAAVSIPPLREGREAIGALCAHFVAQYNRSFGRQVSRVSRDALCRLAAYDWPGNVREFAQAIQRAVLESDGERIDIAALPEYLHAPAAARKAATTARAQAADDPAPGENDLAAGRPEEPWPLALDEVIKRTLLRSLRETEGNRRRAASLLGISRSTLYRMLSRYGLAGFGRGPGGPLPSSKPGMRG
jgi:DNA-binding NtrC family response regulator